MSPVAISSPKRRLIGPQQDLGNRQHVRESAVIYFFSKGREYFQCEIHWGQPHLLTLVSSDGSSQSERYGSSADLSERWLELVDDMEDSGWTGPFGRDPRS